MTGIARADLSDPRVLDLLRLHVAQARAETAPGSAHALDSGALEAPDIEVFALWDDQTLLGVAALKHLSDGHGEVKSMFVAPASRGRGAGRALLRHLIAAAQVRGMSRLSLETGAWDYFAAARALYRRHGFVECAPFAEYVEDANSVFMTRDVPASTAPPPG